MVDILRTRSYQLVCDSPRRQRLFWAVMAMPSFILARMAACDDAMKQGFRKGCFCVGQPSQPLSWWASARFLNILH